MLRPVFILNLNRLVPYTMFLDESSTAKFFFLIFRLPSSVPGLLLVIGCSSFLSSVIIWQLFWSWFPHVI